MNKTMKKIFLAGLMSSFLITNECKAAVSSRASYPVTSCNGVYAGAKINENGTIEYIYDNYQIEEETEQETEQEMIEEIETEVPKETIKVPIVKENMAEKEKIIADNKEKIVEKEDLNDSCIEKINDNEEKYCLSEVVKGALFHNAKEIKDSIEKNITDNLYMTIVEENIDGNDVYVSHLVVNDPEQFEKLVANEHYDNGREKVSSMASKAGVVWACNGSHFDLNNCSTQDYRNNNIAICNGEVVHNGGCSVGHEICYTSDGRWFTAPKGATAQDLLNMGVIETYSSLQMPILENGHVSEATSYEESEELAKTYNRTVIGQTDNGETFVLTGKTTTKTAAEYLRNKGCTWAKSMDMGGSVTLYANGKLINEPTDDAGERAVIDGVGVLK